MVQGSVMLAGLSQEDGFALLDQSFEEGCRTIDTAAVYGYGNENSIGNWIKARDNREEMVILAKGAHHDEKGPRVTPKDITFDIGLTMGRMNVNHLDLYVLHRDNPSVSVGPIMERLNEHADKGDISAFGVSNWHTQRIIEANDYAEKHNLRPFVASSPNFSMVDQVDEPWANCISICGEQGEAERAWYEQTQMAVFAWSTLAGGFLSGAFTRENQDDSNWNELVKRCYVTEDNWKRLDRAGELAKRYEVSVAQISMAYVLCHPMNTYALVAPRTPAEATDCAKAFRLELSSEDIAYLELR